MKINPDSFPLFRRGPMIPTSLGNQGGNLIASPPVYIADLYTIGPMANGQTITVTNGGGDITTSTGTKFYAKKYGAWQRDSITTKVGLESNGTRLTVFTGSNVPVMFPGTNSLLNDGIKYGLLGNAPVMIQTAFMSTYGTVPGSANLTGGIITQFQGMVTDIVQVGFTKAVIQIQDMLYLLNQKIPNRIVQASCTWVLYSPGCTANAAAFTVPATVGFITSSYQFSPTSNFAAPVTNSATPGTYTQGTLKWVTGQNAGLAYFVRYWNPGSADPSGRDQIQLDVAPIFPISVGDQFVISQGCDKSFNACTQFLGGTAAYSNFGGFPTVPVPETAI